MINNLQDCPIRTVVNPQIAALSTRNHRKFLYLKAFS